MRGTPTTPRCRDCGVTDGTFPSKAEAERKLRERGWTGLKRHSGFRCPGCNKAKIPTKLLSKPLLREIILDHLRGSKKFRDIYQDVVDDYGSVSKRTVQRALARLYVDGRVERIGPRGQYEYRKVN